MVSFDEILLRRCGQNMGELTKISCAENAKLPVPFFLYA